MFFYIYVVYFFGLCGCPPLTGLTGLFSGKPPVVERGGLKGTLSCCLGERGV